MNPCRELQHLLEQPLQHIFKHHHKHLLPPAVIMPHLHARATQRVSRAHATLYLLARGSPTETNARISAHRRCSSEMKVCSDAAPPVLLETGVRRARWASTCSSRFSRRCFCFAMWHKFHPVRRAETPQRAKGRRRRCGDHRTCAAHPAPGLESCGREGHPSASYARAVAVYSRGLTARWH